MLFILLASIIFTLLVGAISFSSFKKLYEYLWLFPASVFIGLLFKSHSLIEANNLLLERYEWIPTIGINIHLSLTGLSWFFSLLITGIGSLIFYYAGAYMKGKERVGAFFSYLSLFMTAMLGLVFSDNLILLFLFWELTSIASFFLIGFDYQEKAVRQSAMLSLGITGGGGFFLLLAFVLIGNATGTYNLSEIEVSSLQGLLEVSGTLNWVIISLMIGAVTKSAQFPFHFWLPNAMKAPTPVSAYLHSATMVKAGVFILMVFAPYFQGIILWHQVLFAMGLITLVYAAFQSLFQTDLKGILAYSTVASLGMMVMLIGIGTEKSYMALLFFILAHALYKAGLFITAGSLDVITGTRNIHHLRGWNKTLPLLSVSAFIVAASNGGFPLTLGFMGKDYVYESLLSQPFATWVIIVLVVLANVCLMFAGVLVGWRPFFGNKSKESSSQNLPKKSKIIALSAPVLVLALASIGFGVFPSFTFQFFLAPAYQRLAPKVTEFHFGLFPGWNNVLLLSVLTLLLGLGLYFWRKGVPFSSRRINSEHSFNLYHWVINFHQSSKRIAHSYTRLLHNGYLRNYILYIILFFIGLIGYEFLTTVEFVFPEHKLTPFGTYEIAIFLVISVSIFFTVFTSSRLTAIASMGIIGYCMCLMFVFYGAPDLAMTQFSIDTLTVVLFVLVLYKLPRFKKYVSWKTEIRDGLVSLSFGTLVALIALQAYSQPVVKEVSDYYASFAHLKAKGKNVVNVILVDFRGFDTMVEIIVLSIAAVGVYSLLKLNTEKLEQD